MLVVERAERRDKGSVRIGPRDLETFRWLVEMRVMYEDDLRVKLGADAGRGPLSESAVRQLVGRWERAGLARADRLIVGKSRLLGLTPDGARLAGVEGTWHESAPWSAYHTAEVAHVRLWLERMALTQPFREGAVWRAERLLRQETWPPAAATGRDVKRPHVPDGVILSGQRQWAVEVERTQKSTRRLQEIMVELVSTYDWTLYAVPQVGGDLVAFHVERAWESVQSLHPEIRSDRLSLRRYPAALEVMPT